MSFEKYENLRHCFAMTNYYKCVFTNDITRSNKKTSDIMEKNCSEILIREISVLKPDIVIIQGKGHPTFWKEIKYLASNETRKRDEGKNSSRRCFYEQCYVLSLQPLKTVNRLTWRQWQDLLDREDNREDERIFDWLGSSEEKIREDDWREFEKALHLYLKDKDTSVFEDEELFAIYDSIMLMSVKWREQFKVFEQEHPKSAKIKTKGTWAKKYYARCFVLKKEQRSKVVTEEMCQIAFSELIMR
jgi:hypothetical protein